VLSLNLAMWGLTWYLSAMSSALVPLYASRSSRERGSRSIRPARWLLFLLGVAGDEGVARDLLDFPDIVVEQDVGNFVSYVTVGPPRVAARVADGDGTAIRQVKRCRGERAGWVLFKFFEAGAVDEGGPQG